MLNSFVFSGLIYNEGQITAASPTGLYIIGTLSGTTAAALSVSNSQIRDYNTIVGLY
jgi:hypothetical protein